MKIYNFSAGPACMPESVLQAVRDASIEYEGAGMSVLEMSHRSRPIVELFDSVTSSIRELLDVPSNYHILWLQGGASLQFSMIPLNLLPENGKGPFLWLTFCDLFFQPLLFFLSKHQDLSDLPSLYHIFFEAFHYLSHLSNKHLKPLLV